MTSYTVQQHNTTGDTHALRWEDTSITGISDAFCQQSVESMTAGMLPQVAYHPYQSDPTGLGADGFVAWQPPVLEWSTKPAFLEAIKEAEGRRMVITDPRAALFEALDRLFHVWRVWPEERRQFVREGMNEFADANPWAEEFMTALLADLEEVGA